MIGQFAASKAGHDKDTLYVIVAEEGDFVALSDGRSKPLERPKRKRKKHIQLIAKTVGGELLDALKRQRASDEQIKYALKQYRRSLKEDSDGTSES